MIMEVVRRAPADVDFEELFKEQFKHVYNYLYYHIGNAQDAEDLTADVFTRAYEYRGSFSAAKGSSGAWLGGIARNMLKTYYQKKAKRPQTVELSELIYSNIYIEDDYIHKEILERMFKQIDQLPERQKELIAMKYLLGLTNRDIAKMVNMTESNVGVTLHRTLKDLKSKLS